MAVTFGRVISTSEGLERHLPDGRAIRYRGPFPGGSASHREKLPVTRHPFQFLFTSVLELDT